MPLRAAFRLACKMSALLFFLAAAAGANVSAAEPSLLCTSRTCGIDFRYPSNWSVTRAEEHQPAPDDPHCILRLQPRNLKRLIAEHNDIDYYSIEISVFNEDFDIQLLRSRSYERKDGKWIVLGRMDIESPGEAITGNGWWGVRGSASVGCYAEHGGYKGLCESPRAFIGSHSKHSANIEANPLSDDVLDLILKTFRFRER